MVAQRVEREKTDQNRDGEDLRVGVVERQHALLFSSFKRREKRETHPDDRDGPDERLEERPPEQVGRQGNEGEPWPMQVAKLGRDGNLAVEHPAAVQVADRAPLEGGPCAAGVGRALERDERARRGVDRLGVRALVLDERVEEVVLEEEVVDGGDGGGKVPQAEQRLEPVEDRGVLGLEVVQRLPQRLGVVAGRRRREGGARRVEERREAREEDVVALPRLVLDVLPPHVLLPPRPLAALGLLARPQRLVALDALAHPLHDGARELDVRRLELVEHLAVPRKVQLVELGVAPHEDDLDDLG